MGCLTRYRRITGKAPWNYESQFMGCILQHFPPRMYRHVLEVAGGQGRIAAFLTHLGYKVTVADPNVPKRGKGLPPKVRPIRREFLVGDARGHDLIIGLAPCDASQKMLRVAKRKPFVFWPCRCSHIWPCGQRTPVPFLREMGIKYRKQGEIFWAPQLSKR